MSLCGAEEIQQLPNSLQDYVNSFDIHTATEINLSSNELTDENLSLFINCITSKYTHDYDTELFKKLFALELNNAKNDIQLQKAKSAFQTGVKTALSARMADIVPDYDLGRNRNKAHNRLRNVVAEYDPYYQFVDTLDEQRSPIIMAAFKEAIFEQYEIAGLDAAKFTPAWQRNRNESSLNKNMAQYKDEYFIWRAKKDLKAKGLGMPIDERRGIQLVNYGTQPSFITHFLAYPYKIGLLDRQSNVAVPNHVIEEYRKWVWPQLQEEAYKQFEEELDVKRDNYDLDNSISKRKYFEAVYTQHYEGNLKDQNLGHLNIFPQLYGSSIYPKETIQSTFDFMSKGAFRNKLSTAKFEMRIPKDRMGGKLNYSFNDFLKPFAEHVENGRPIPFSKIEVNHEFPPTSEEEANEVLDNMLRIAKGIADHPADYFKLASVGMAFTGDMRTFKNHLKIEKYLEFMQALNELVNDPNKPLRAEIDLDEVNQYYYDQLDSFEEHVKTLPRGWDEVDEETLGKYETLKETVEQIDYYRFHVAKNRRELNSKILLKGEESLGDLTPIEMAEPEQNLVYSIDDIRACKRSTDLQGALMGASMEKEMENEEAQEKEKEKEKEKEAEMDQDQDQDKVHGNANDNLKDIREFGNYIREISTYYIEKEHIEQLWHNLCGETETTVENQWAPGENKAIAKEAVRVMMKDPDGFRSGLVDGNLPQGFHFGLLGVENGSVRGIYYDPTEPNLTEENPLTIQMGDPIEPLPRLKASPAHFQVKQKLTGIKGGLIKLAIKAIPGANDPLRQPSKEEIDSYNKGRLNTLNVEYGAPGDGWIVVGKMAFCTSKTAMDQGIGKLNSWRNSPITKAMAKVVEPQAMAEYAISLGGDAIFQLTERLEEVQKKCHKLGEDEMFDTFLNDFVIQDGIDSWLKKPNAPDFCEHIFRHGQFEGFQQLLELDDADLKFFMTFVNQHAKHHSRVDLMKLLNNFKYFKAEYNEIFPEQDLPLDNIETFAASCNDMRVGMDRMLSLLRNAQKNGLENEQLAVLTQLDLGYQTAYHAVEHNKFKLVLPEMKVDKETLKQDLLPKKSLITALQSTFLYNQMMGLMSTADYRKQFYRQYALIDDTPSFERFKALDNTISQISSDGYEHPEAVKSFMYSLSGFALYHPNTAIDVKSHLEQSEDLTNIKDFLSKSKNTALLIRINKITDGTTQKNILIELNTNLGENRDLTISELTSTVDRLDVYDANAITNLAKAVDELDLGDDLSKDKYAKFFQQILECQEPYINGSKPRGAPTPESLQAYIQTIERLHNSGLFVAIEPRRDEIHRCFKPRTFFENSGTLFETMYQIEKRETEDKLTDEQLAHLLVALENKSHVALDNPDPVNKKFSQIEGGLFVSMGLIQQPDENFIANAENENSLAHFIASLREQACGENTLAFESLQDALHVLECVDWDNVDPRPTFSQMKSMLNNAMRFPQPNYESLRSWMTSDINPGFSGMQFDITKLAEKNVQSVGMDEVFQRNKAMIVGKLSNEFEDIQIDELRTNDFEDFIDYLIELDVESQAGKFANANTIAYMKQTLFLGAKGGLSLAKKQSLSDKLKQQEKEKLLECFDRNYAIEDSNPTNLIELKQSLVKIKATQEHTSSFLSAVDTSKEKLGHKFSLLLNVLADGEYTDIPIEQMTKLINTVVDDFIDNKIFNHAVLSTAVSFEHLDEIKEQWPLINNIIKSQMLESSVDKAKATSLLLNLAHAHVLRENDITNLLAISEVDMDVYNEIVSSVGQCVEGNIPFNLSQINTATQALLENGIEKKVLVSFLENPHNLQILQSIHQIQDIQKKKAIVQIVDRAVRSSEGLGQDALTELVNKLDNLDADDLTTLSLLDIDAEYPSVAELTTSAHRLHTEDEYNLDDYIVDLQKDFFAQKNNPKLLSRLFNDGRVIEVIDKSETLKFAKDLRLSNDKKEKLLSDYAFIHAIGLNKPVYHNKAMKDLTKGELKTLKQELTDIIQGDELDSDKHLAMLKMIALSREVYYRATLPDGRFPYSTQVMSVLMAVDNGNLNINEIATGQGKSLTAALYATVMHAQGKPAIICTSNMTLAKEGMLENEKYYEYMDIPATLVRAQTSAIDFQHAGVNYTDVSNMALFLAKNEISGSFDVENPGLILDEADFTVLDEVTDFRYAVNLSSEDLASEVNMDEWLYYQINEFVDDPKFTEVLVDRQTDVSNALVFLRKKCKTDVESGALTDPFKSHIEDRLLDMQMEGSNAQKQLDTWIDSAWNANIIYKEGKDEAWVLEKFQHKDGNYYNAARIISHHRVASGSKWSKGVHQFLHARINTNKNEEDLPCRVDAEKSHVAAYSSKNFVDYFINRGGAVWGMTGTVGSRQECAELREKYGFNLARIEAHQTRTATDLKPVFRNGGRKHLETVYGLYEANSLKKRQMPTVIVEENAKLAGEFKDKFFNKIIQNAKLAGEFKYKFFSKIIQNAGKYNPPPTMQFYNGLTLEIYDYKDNAYHKRDIKADFGGEFKTEEEKEEYIKKIAGQGNTVTITTPMMGRGTDFKPKMAHPDQEGTYQDHPDGLFVIQNYAEGSLREERQIQGRMGRQGKKGLYVNVVDTSRFIQKLKATVPNPPRSITGFNQTRLEAEMDKYKASSNSNLAKERQLKQTYGDMRGHFYQKFIGMMSFSNEDQRFNEVKHLLKDVDGFNEAKFKSEYNKFMLENWNRFLIDIDKKFILLKDEHKNDYEKIFPALEEFCFNEWNKKIINGIKNSQFSDPKVKLEGDALFAEFQEFKPEQLEQYAELMYEQSLINEEREKMESEQTTRDMIIKGVTENPEETKVLLKLLMPESEYNEMLDQAIDNPQLMETVLTEKLEHQTERSLNEKLNKRRELLALINDPSLEPREIETAQQKLDELLLPEYEDSDYEQAFEERLYHNIIQNIVAKGRKAALLDPDLTIQRDELERNIINYNKHFWLKDVQSLKQAEEPEKEIAQIMAIDVTNEIFKLNNGLQQDKILGFETKTPFEVLGIDNPFPGSEPEDIAKANKHLADYINQAPQLSLPLLQEYYMDTCISAQLAASQTQLQSTRYTKLLNYHKQRQNGLLDTLSEVSFDNQELINGFRRSFTGAEQAAKIKAENATFTFLLRTNPEMAIDFKIAHDQLKPENYTHDDLIQSIQEDGHNYLKSKWLNKSRKKNAKILLADLENSQDINQTLAALLKARSHALQSDIKAFGTKNKSGSRYQRLLDKSITRTIASADNQGDLLLCADHMRKEMAQQLNYLKSKFDSAFFKNYFEPIYQSSLTKLGMQNPDNPQDLSLKELDSFINHYSQALHRLKDSKSKGGFSAPSSSMMTAVNIMDENLAVFKTLKRKMIAEGMDMQSEDKVVKDISLETNVYEIATELELDAGQHKELTQLLLENGWPDLSVEQWNDRFVLECANSDIEPPTIQKILGHGSVVTNIKPSDMHKIVAYSQNPELWNAYLAQAHENNIQMIERNNPKFDRAKFPSAKTIEEIIGDNRAPSSPVEFFKIITEMNRFKNQIASPTSQSDRIQLFSMTGQLHLPVDILGEHAKQFIDNASHNVGQWGPPLTENKTQNIYAEFDNIDRDLTESEAWQNYWHNNEANVIRSAKSALIKQKQNEYVRARRKEHPEDKNLPKSVILKNFDLESIDEIHDFDGQQAIAKIKSEILSAYRFKVISSAEFIDTVDVEYQLKTTRCKDFLQRINAKKRRGKNYQDANQELKVEFEDGLRSEIQSSMIYYEDLVKQGKSLDSILGMMDNNIARVKTKCFNVYLGLNVNANDFINPLIEQHQKYLAFNQLLDEQLDVISNAFVPAEEGNNNTRILELVKTSVDVILNNPAYTAMGVLGRDALKARLTSKESIEAVYNTALAKRTEHFKNKIISHYANKNPGRIDWLLNSEETGVKWISYPRARRELIANLYSEVNSGRQLFSPNIHDAKSAGNNQKALMADLILAYKETIEEDLKSMPKQHAKALLERLKDDPLLMPSGIRNPFKKNPRDEVIAQWDKLVDERPDTPLYAVPGLMTKDSHTGLDVNLGLWKELENVINRSEADNIAIEMMKVERQIYDLPQEREYILTNNQMKAMLDDKQSHDKIKHSLSSISNLDERISKIQTLFNEARQEENFNFKSKYGLFGGSKESDNQKRIIGLLQGLFVDTVKSLALKHAHTAVEDSQIKWSDQLPEEIPSDVVDTILSEVLNPAIKNYMLNAGVSELREQSMKAKITKLIDDVGSRRHQEVEPNIVVENRQRQGNLGGRL